MQQPSDVEQYWQAIATKFGDTRKWSDLNINQQQVVIQSVNAMLAVLHRLV